MIPRPLPARDARPMSDTVAAAAPLLAQQGLVELLALVKDADSVELKLSVDAGLQRSAVEALGLDPLEAQVRLVHFFDTPDLALERAGVVVRARRVQGKGDDTVVKLRPVRPRLAGPWRPAAQAVHEGAARVLRRARTGVRRARRPRRARPDLRAQDEGHATCVRAQARHRALAVPRR